MSKNNLNFELVQSLYETLIERVKEEIKKEPVKTPFAEKEMSQTDKERLLRRWRNSEGFYYLNPEKFKFSLKNL